MTRAETIGRIVATWLVLLNPATPAVVMAEEATPETRVHFNIPRQPADLALTQFAEQANLTLLFPTDGVQERTANELVGEYTLDEAIDVLLAGTGLAPTFKNRLVLDIAIDDESTVMGEAMDIKKKAGLVGILAGVFAGDVNAQDSSQEPEREKLPLEEIIVTGTNIRGIAPESSPVRIFDREDIQISGATTAQDFVQTLTTNFGGGSNIAANSGFPNDDSSFFNRPDNGGSAGASVNLRGLGSGSTLVLLNGHRLAPSSGIGDFVDISMIPASALERVEVLTDGASSIYGSDAVAGVVNFILRDDFDGAEASFRSGTVTEGDMDQYRASLTGGKNWGAGHALVVYEYFNQDNLSAGDRSFSQEALLPTDLLPSQKRQSALAAASQDVTPDLEISADFTFSRRETGRVSSGIEGSTTGTSRVDSISDSSSISAGGSWKVSHDWYIDFSGSYSKVDTDGRFVGATSEQRKTDSALWTADAKATGSVFRLSGGDVKLAVGGHYRAEEFSNTLLLGSGTERGADRDVYAVFGEAFIPIVGSGNAVPGIERLEVNASGRFDHFSDFGSTTNPKVGVLWSPIDGVNLRGSYSTSFNPPPLGRIGVSDSRGLALSTAFANAFFGLTPGDPSIADVVILSLSGTSKSLDAENSRAFTGGLDISEEWGSHQLAVKSTYFDIKFENRLGDTPCPTCTNNTIFDMPNIAFSNPELFPEGTVIFSPTMDQITNALNSLDAPVTSFFGADPLDAEILLFANIVRNLSLTFVRGVDFELDYTHDSDVGSFSLGLDGTYLVDFQQQAAVRTPKVELLNTQFNPVDLTLRGHAGYVRNGFAANVFVNYKDSYRSDNTTAATGIDSWTTVDSSLSYDTREALSNPVLQNTVLRLSVINLFDEDPPSSPGRALGFNIFGYDPANASPLGRFIAFELTKRF